LAWHGLWRSAAGWATTISTKYTDNKKTTNL
jgi:hypothetical protein